MLDTNAAPAPAAAPPVLDGSIDSAAMALTQARGSEPAAVPLAPEAPTQNRAPDGKFTKVEDSKPAEPAKDAAPAEDEEDDWLELEEPPEAEGQEPKKVRHKLTEVWEGFQKAKTLEQELTKVKTEAPPPVEWERETEATIAERTNYLDALQKWQAFNPARAPNEDLINPAHPNYNPDAYWQQSQAFKQAQADHQAITAEVERVEKLNRENAEAVLKAKAFRERNKILEVWPELKDKAVVDKTLAELKGTYGFDDQTLGAVIDSRFYKLAKDALAFRAGQAAKQEAVRKVTAKPKLVRASARSAIDGKTAARQDAVGRLSQSGSLDDAAAALSALR